MSLNSCKMWSNAIWVSWQWAIHLYCSNVQIHMCANIYSSSLAWEIHKIIWTLSIAGFYHLLTLSIANSYLLLLLWTMTSGRSGHLFTRQRHDRLQKSSGSPQQKQSSRSSKTNCREYPMKVEWIIWEREIGAGRDDKACVLGLAVKKRQY